MSLTFAGDLAVFDDTVGVEDAETLLEWIQEHPAGEVDCSNCKHLHAADLQVLMAARIAVAAWPHDEKLKTWLAAALEN